MIVNQARESAHRHSPEDRPILELACPHCGVRMPIASQPPLGRIPSQESDRCLTCGREVRPVVDATHM